MATGGRKRIPDRVEMCIRDRSKEDFRDGLTAVVSVKVAEPQFEGQTKTKLGNNEVSGVVQSAVSEALRYYLEEHPKEAKAIVDKVALAATARHAAYNARMKVQRKSPLSGAGLPGKLADCKSRAAAACELFLVEGDSVSYTHLFPSTEKSASALNVYFKLSPSATGPSTVSVTVTGVPPFSRVRV